jgi:tetratricopeptide (TPR) repeat protein
MSEGPNGNARSTLGMAEARRLDEVCDAFERAWKDSNGTPPAIDDYLEPLPAQLHQAAVLELLPLDIAYRGRRGQSIPLESYRQRYPFAEKYMAQWTSGNQRPQPTWRLAAGDPLGKYTIIGPLGAGGMGEVYRAVDSTLRRDVAIKVLHSRHAANAEALDRIRMEAQALAALNHEHILTVHELSEQDGLVYMVLELLHGETLAERLKRQPLLPTEVLDLAAQLAGALAAAHQEQIVHRDFKPQNIFLTTGGQAKILDFGLARLVKAPAAGAADETSPASEHYQTVAGARLGTTGYMSPEQVRGQTVDARSDVFTFGCVLLEMITREPAFARLTVSDSDEAIQNEPAPRPDALRRGELADLAPIVARCLAKAPQDRYASAVELNQDLANMRAAQERKKGRTLRRLERAALAVCGLVALLLGGWLIQSLVADWQHDVALEKVRAALSDRDIERALIIARTIDLRRPIASDPNDPDSTRLEALVKGFLALERGKFEDIEEAIEWFRIANSSKDQTALAHVGLALCHYRLSSVYVAPDVSMQHVKSHAQAALALDAEGKAKSSAIAHVLLGLYYHRYERNWKTAHAEFEHALDIHFYSPMAHRYLGHSLALQHGASNGTGELTSALQLDPDSADIKVELALACLYAGHGAQAEKYLQEVLSSNRDSFPAQWAMGEVYLAREDYAQAIQHLRAARALDEQSPEVKAELAFCLARSGEAIAIHEAQRTLHELQQKAGAENRDSGERYVPHTAVAVAQLGLQMPSEAMESLNMGYADHDEWLVWLEVDPVFELARKDPRFIALRNKIGLWGPTDSTATRDQPPVTQNPKQ